MLEWLQAEWPQVLGFVTGAICVWLAGRRNVWNYPIGIANNVVLFVVFIGAGLYATAVLQVVYLLMGAHGWWRWTRGAEQSRTYVANTPRRAWPWLVLAAVVGAAVLVWVLTTFTDSQVAIPDAATTAASLVAQYMLNRKWIENWFVWIGVDIAFVALSIVAGLWVIAALYALFVGLCLIGYRSWRRAALTDREADPAATSSMTSESARS
ncbi:nicotinamide mononucleotide transporter [Microbacterium phyllosphaerae]|uniref:Nicotinamide mononucleotide transporter n=1 Tax=Microbacterium phyllosphaerae TaxID=124798 RepID=A0ABS4WTZ9_9MICO|nr:nicotinamide riboside transporter PnuC [Microbacterium phyllosphaerae]MBP2379682.1 nicotinamide mononucleotide transporter [Microbacterium phyllosphaerae]